MKTLKFRIITEKFKIRSLEAYQSQKFTKWINLEAIKPNINSYYKGQIGCMLSHKLCLKTFIKSHADFAIIIEDDAIFSGSKEWINYKNYDLFFPYRYSRKNLEENLSITYFENNKRRIYNGTMAYLINKNIATLYLKIYEFINLLLTKDLPEEEKDIIEYCFSADTIFSLLIWINNIRNLKYRIAQYNGNSVNHDNNIISSIHPKMKTINQCSEEEILENFIPQEECLNLGLDPAVYYPKESIRIYNIFENLLKKYNIENIVV